MASSSAAQVPGSPGYILQFEIWYSMPIALLLKSAEKLQEFLFRMKSTISVSKFKISLLLVFIQ